jgi:hypothetical protein
MGLRPKLESPDIYSFSDTPWFTSRGGDPEKIMDDIANYAKYHSDWNWLMGVVEEIEDTQYGKYCKNTFPVVTINVICCNIKFHHNREIVICNIIRPTKMEAVHEAVFEFIQWYNKKES